jgi:serpin B
MRTLASILLGLSFLLFACGKDTAEPDIVPPIQLTPKQKAVVNASNYFGFNMLRTVDQALVNENYMISPLSISAALGMTWNGAQGQTAQEMQQVLGFAGLSAQDVNEAYQKMLNYLISSDPKVTLEIANSIWHNQDFSVLPSFVAANQTYFNADVIAANFGDPATVGQINQWVSTNTHGKITSIIDNIPALTVMYLINATYFKGDWTYRFKETDTYTAQFFPEGGAPVNVDMMKTQADLDAFSDANMQGIRMPYGDGRYYLMAVMPSPGLALSDLIVQLDTNLWQQWLQMFAKYNGLELHFPKFKFEKELRLNDHLAQMGMPQAFSPGVANFAGINPMHELYIDEVKHKTYIDVNEKGTEAAAVTSVSINVTSVGSAMMFNRPFLFFIVEKHTGYVVFAGKVEEPVY